MNFSKEQIKSELVRRLESGEITRDQARQAVEKYKASMIPEAEPTLVPPQPMIQEFGPNLAASGSIMGQGRPVSDTSMASDHSIGEHLQDIFTGDLRKTPTSESLPDWSMIPLGGGIMDQILASAATLTTGPEETANIIVANLGEGASWAPDEKGNPIITHPSGQKYAYKPGFRATDIPRVIGTGLREYVYTIMTGGLDKFIKGGRIAHGAYGLARGAGAGVVEQGIEAMAGGEFNPLDVAIGAVPEGFLEMARFGKGASDLAPDARPVQGPTVRPETGPVTPKKPLFVKTGEDLQVNNEFDGTIREVVQELNDASYFFGDEGTAAVRTLNELTNKAKEFSGGVMGRTQADDFFDLPVSKMLDDDVQRYAADGKNVEGLFRVSDDGSADYKLGDKLLFRPGMSPDRMAKVMAHEITHAATTKELDSRLNAISKGLGRQMVENDAGERVLKVPTTQEIKLALDTNGVQADDPIRSLVNAYDVAREKIPVDEYGFENLHEFIAEAFSNADFQRKLGQIEIPGAQGGGTLWQRIVVALRDMLDLKDTSALSETIRATEDIMGGMGRRSTKGIGSPLPTKGSKSVLSVEPGSYRISHTAPGPEDGMRNSADDLSDIYPDLQDLDVKTFQKYYGAGQDGEDRVVQQIKKMAGNPDAEVTVYRAVPQGVKDINAGDWVTPSKEYAELHMGLDGAPQEIISKQVKASEIFTNGDSMMEWGYSPGSYRISKNPTEEFSALEKRVEDAYRSGDQAAIDEAETRYEDFVRRFEDVDADMEESFVDQFRDGIDRDLAKSYGRMSRNIENGLAGEEEMIANLRETVEEYLGPQRANSITDKELLKEGKRAYEKSRPTTMDAPSLSSTSYRAGGPDSIDFKGEKATVRNIATHFDERAKKSRKRLSRTDHSQKAIDQLGEDMADEALYEIQNAKKSALGWYTKKYNNAIDMVAENGNPELKIQGPERKLFTMFTALTSDGTAVPKNFEHAVKLYEEFKATGKIDGQLANIGGERAENIVSNLGKFMAQVDKHGLKKTMDYLSEEVTVKELNAELRKMGLNPTSGFLATEKVPRSAMFGPKLGIFFANLSGMDGYLTMDRWWSRSLNRLRGQLQTEPTQKSLDEWRKFRNRPNMRVSSIKKEVEELADAYAKTGFKDKRPDYVKANSIAKKFNGTEDAPFNGADRRFHGQVAKKAADVLREKGYDVSTADLQALMWYYEKRLYNDLGNPAQLKDFDYETSATDFYRKRLGSGDGSGSAGRGTGSVRAGRELGLDDAVDGQRTQRTIEAPSISKDGEVDKEALADLVNKARLGSTPATRNLAVFFQENPEAVADARSLGLELPSDVLSDSYEAQATAGLTRKVQGSPGEIAWREKIEDLTTRADAIMRENEALYTGDGVSISDAADRVGLNLEQEMYGLQKTAQEVFDEVDKKVPKRTPAKITNTVEYLTNLVEDLGGPKGLNPAESKLWEMIVDDETLTYGRLLREKRRIFAGLDRKQRSGPYADVDEFELGELYEALRSDQIANVENIDEGLAVRLDDANGLWAQKKEIEKKLVEAFGKDGFRNLGGNFAKAMKNIAESQTFDKLFNIVPKHLQKEVLMTGIARVSRSTVNTSATKGRFGFSEFSDFMRSLRSSTSRTSQFKDILGPKTWKTLRSLDNISRRLTRARALASKGTGADMQPILQKLEAENLITKILESGPVRGSVRMTTGRGGESALGALASITSTGGGRGLDDLHNLLTSQRFQDIIAKGVEKGMTKERVARQLARDSVFRRFAKSIGEDITPRNLERWIIQNMRATQTTTDGGQENE